MQLKISEMDSQTVNEYLIALEYSKANFPPNFSDCWSLEGGTLFTFTIGTFTTSQPSVLKTYFSELSS